MSTSITFTTGLETEGIIEIELKGGMSYEKNLHSILMFTWLNILS